MIISKTSRINEPVNEPKAELLCCGLDVHSTRIVLRYQYDGGQPRPGQGFSPDRFRDWIVKQKSKAHRVVCCYEAGPFGFVLARWLIKQGIECLVVAPENLDSRHKRVKTDKVDALQLLRRLASYEQGNEESFSVVRIPSEAEEQERSELRLREQLKCQRQSLQKMGKSLLLTQGLSVKSSWWKPCDWEELVEDLAEWLVDRLRVLREVLVVIDEQEQQLRKRLESVALPEWAFCGLAQLSYQQISLEVCDWSRFNNRREVGSYTGLCPSVHESNKSSRYGSITKHGNPRLRWALVELAWRVKRFQPDYWKLKKLESIFEKKGRGTQGKRKQAIVALARQLAIDMWRLATGQTTLERLGLRVAKA